MAKAKKDTAEKEVQVNPELAPTPEVFAEVERLRLELGKVSHPIFHKLARELETTIDNVLTEKRRLEAYVAGKREDEKEADTEAA